MTTDTDLADVLVRAREAVPVGTWWRHRGGGHYQVTGHCLIEATLEAGVLYQRRHLVTWCRPLAEFADGRFTRLGQMPGAWEVVT